MHASRSNHHPIIRPHRPITHPPSKHPLTHCQLWPFRCGLSVVVRPGGRHTLSRSLGLPFRVPRRRAPLTVAQPSALLQMQKRHPGTTQKLKKLHHQHLVLTSRRIRITHTCQLQCVRTR